MIGFNWEQPGMSPLFTRSPIQIHDEDDSAPLQASCSIERVGCRANIRATLHEAGPTTRVHIMLSSGREVPPEVHHQFNVELLSAQLAAEAFLLTAAGRSTAEVDEHVSLASVTARFIVAEQLRDETTRANRYH